MKKVFCLFLSIIMLLMCNNTYYCDEKEAIDDNWYSFIYTNDEQWRYFRDNYVKSEDCIEGYLYSKNLANDKIYLINDTKTDIFIPFGEEILFISHGNLYKSDHYGNNITKIIHNTKLNGDALSFYDNYAFVVIDTSLYRVDLDTKVYEKMVDTNGINLIYAVNKTKVLLGVINSDYNYLVFDERDGSISYYDSLMEIQFVTDWGSTFLTEQEFISHCSSDFLYNFSPVISDFRVNEFFTTTGNPCPVPGYNDSGCVCIKYCGAKQCYGFARYACDKFNHCEIGFNSSFDQKQIANACIQTGSNIISIDDMKVYIQSCQSGTHIRLSKISSNDNYSHSFIYVDSDNNYLYTYEANWSNSITVNGVKLYNNVGIIRAVRRTWSQLYTWFNATCERVNHTYTCSSFNSTYHKYQCSENGCNACKYEAHKLLPVKLYYNASMHSTPCRTAGCSGVLSAHTLYIDDGHTVCSGCLHVFN